MKEKELLNSYLKFIRETYKVNIPMRSIDYFLGKDDGENESEINNICEKSLGTFPQSGKASPTEFGIKYSKRTNTFTSKMFFGNRVFGNEEFFPALKENEKN